MCRQNKTEDNRKTNRTSSGVRRRTIRESNQFIADEIEEYARVKRSLRQQQGELCHNISQQWNNWYDGRQADPACGPIICNSWKFLCNGLSLVYAAVEETLCEMEEE